MMDNKKQIIYGRHPVVDAIKAGQTFDKLYLQQGIRGEMEKELRHLSKAYQIPLQVVPKERLGKWTKGNHQGVVGLLSLISYYKLEDLLPHIYEQSETPLLVVLEGITDVRNFGAIARTAECMGVHGLVVSKKRSAWINADAIKTSAGALTKIPVCRENSIINAIEFLQQSGIAVVASDLKATKHLQDLDLAIPTAIIVGAEGDGISQAVSRAANDSFIIPQFGTTDSMNVSVATGIMLYEVQRQRNLVGGS